MKLDLALPRGAGRTSRPDTDRLPPPVCGHPVGQGLSNQQQNRAGSVLPAWRRIGEVSRRTGVPVHTLRAWERRYGLLRPRRSSGNFRLYSGADEKRVRLMLQHLERGVAPAEAAELAAAARLGVRAGDGRAVSREESTLARAQMREALDAFDEASAQRILERLFAAHTPSTVVRDVLMPCLRELGSRWERSRASVAQEHFASNFIHARLLALARGWDRGNGPRALLACVPGEQHVLALVAFGITLHELGWRIVYLGADTPIEAAHEAAVRVDPAVVVLAATMPPPAERILGPLGWLAADVPVCLAGAGVSDGFAEDVGGSRLALDPVGAAEALASEPAPVR